MLAWMSCAKVSTCNLISPWLIPNGIYKADVAIAAIAATTVTAATMVATAAAQQQPRQHQQQQH